MGLLPLATEYTVLSHRPGRCLVSRVAFGGLDGRAFGGYAFGVRLSNAGQGRRVRKHPCSLASRRYLSERKNRDSWQRNLAGGALALAL